MPMIQTPGLLIETPPDGNADYRAVLLADVLSHIRLSGALFLRGCYSAPWAVESPANCELIDLLAPETERLIVFHAVRKGHLRVSAGGVTADLAPGDVAVLPHAHSHIVGSPDAGTPVAIAGLLPPGPWTDIPTLRLDGGGEAAELVCGYFRCDELVFNAFFRQLPPVFAVQPAGKAAALLEAAIAYAVEDGSRSGGVTALAHINELLLSEVLRLYSEDEAEATGWLRATADPVVSRALKLVHDEPGRDWSADELARRANTSRSVLGERFKALLGQSPIRYLVEWRMQLAADLLRSTSLKLIEIAERSGYGSEAAFSRAFHRHLGQSPAQWRERGVT
ncbi:MAG: AraC family transcriptional regulator [Devosia sp.]